MPFLCLSLQVLILICANFTGGAFSDLIEEETEKFVQFKVLPPGQYKLIFWNKFVRRFYGDLDPSQLFRTDANGNLKFKLDALRRNSEKAISERFFEKRLQSAQTEKGEFIIKKSDAKGDDGQTHVTIVPLGIEGEPFVPGLSAAGPDADIAEQSDFWLNIDQSANSTVLRYHSLDRREETVLGMFDRWLFGKGNLCRTDCFFVHAYLQQMDTHLKQLMHTTKEQSPVTGAAKDFELYFEIGAKLSTAFHSGQLDARALLVEEIIVTIQTLCVTIATFRQIVWRQKQFEKMSHWDRVCQHSFGLQTAASLFAIDRWLTAEGEEEFADGPLQMGDANALVDLVEQLYVRMQMIAERADNGNAQTPPQKRQKYTSTFAIDQIINGQQAQMFAVLGQKLEKAQRTDAKWAKRVAAVSGMLDQLNALCELKSAIASNWGDRSSEWTRAAEAWDSFCPHLDEVQNEWFLESIGRWLNGEKELMADEHSLMEMNLECLVEKMEPAKEGWMNGEEVALLHKIGLELAKAAREKRLAPRVMSAPGVWDQFSNICTLLGAFVAREQTAVEKKQSMELALCWKDAFCGQLDDIYVSAVMNALERWRAGAKNGTDAGVIIGGSEKARDTMDRVAAGETMSKADMTLIAELGAYFAEVIEAQRKAGPHWKDKSKLEPIVGMDKLLKRQCSSWTEFRRKIPPKSRKMFTSWSKICKIVNLKENKSGPNEQIRDKMEENLLTKTEGKKEKKDTKGKGKSCCTDQ